LSTNKISDNFPWIGAAKKTWMTSGWMPDEKAVPGGAVKGHP
jgi:hypothetical protein